MTGLSLSRTRRRLCLAALGAVVAGAAHAQAKALRIVVSFNAGGPVDAVARLLAEPLGQALGRTVVVENRPGANGAIGAAEVLRSEPDGHTLWLTSVGAAAINPALYPKLPYDMQRDFAPVSLVVNNVELLVTHAAHPAHDAAGFIAWARDQKSPPPMASTGVGSIPHLAIEQFADAAHIKLLHVPYKGAAPAITDLIGEQVAGFFGDVAGLLGHVKSGKLKALGLAAPRRHNALPSVKTLAEQGLAGVDTNNWYALFVSSKAPAAEITRVTQAVQAALASAALRERLQQAGTEPAPSTPQELAALLKGDTDKWARLIRARGIKAEQ